MDGASRERVSETLARLQERYQPFEVNQTSVGVPTAVYEEVADAGHVDAHVSVRNDGGELLVRTDGGHTPNVQFDPDAAAPVDAPLEAAFEAETGVACTVEDLGEVSIVAVYDQSHEDREPVYVLEAHFTGHYEEGSIGEEGLSWSESAGAVELSG
jgi:hypothetical protein